VEVSNQLIGNQQYSTESRAL